MNMKVRIVDAQPKPLLFKDLECGQVFLTSEAKAAMKISNWRAHGYVILSTGYFQPVTNESFIVQSLVQGEFVGSVVP